MLQAKARPYGDPYASILARDEYTCQYCGATDVRLVMEHVVPEAAGGPTKDYNLVAACHRCNSRKGSAVWVPDNIIVLETLNPSWAAYIRRAAVVYTPPDKAHKFSVHGIDPAGPIVYALKEAALQDRRTISEIVTEALTQWLADRNGGRP